jgi:hypothetical protein
MPLHYTLASDPPASRGLRRCALPLLLLGMLAGVLAPGLIAGDRPFQLSLCDLEHAPAGCAPRADVDYAARQPMNAKRELIGLVDCARTYPSEAEEQLARARPGVLPNSQATVRGTTDRARGSGSVPNRTRPSFLRSFDVRIGSTTSLSTPVAGPLDAAPSGR